MKNDPNYIGSSFSKTSIDGLIILHKKIFEDERGYFREALKLSVLEEAIGGKFSIKTWNHAVTNYNVLRGIHSESCAKLVYPTHGDSFLVFVDIRPDSRTFGKYEAFLTTEKEERTFYKANGIGIGVLSTSKSTPFEFLYLLDKEYDQISQKGLAWNDPDVNIAWPTKTPILSDRDQTNPTLRELFPDKFKK